MTQPATPPPVPDIREPVAGLDEEVQRHAEWIGGVRQQIARVIVGQKHMVDRLLMGLLTNGHVLLEGVPGVAKTLLINCLAKSISTQFSRIQFTPDLLPADLIGTMIYNPQNSRFDTRKGPIFTNLLLADEINRAPAKVQSALLEAMQERQVTLGDSSYKLEDPFLVMATMNPLEQEGTYHLPEAQLDRFIFKVIMDYPTRSEEMLIQQRMGVSEPDLSLDAVTSPAEIIAARRAVNDIYIDDRVREYIVDIVRATRDPQAYNLDLEGLVRVGGSPRATIYITLAIKALAFLNGRAYATPQDVKDVGLDVLRHRIITSFEAEAEGISSEEIVNRVFAGVPVP